MLSICITVKNRSRVRHKGFELTLLPNCLSSLSTALQGIDVCTWDRSFTRSDFVSKAETGLPPFVNAICTASVFNWDVSGS